MSKAIVSSRELSTLRAVTFRLSSTPTAQLPQQIPSITASLANCKTLLLSTQSSGSKTSSEASVVVHRYRTSISTLLQDRTIQGRWAAIILVKATIEVGGWESLQKSLPWVRHLLEFLSKPDPSSSKKLCIVTLTRIFLLTRDYPTLVREITTPSLPTYIQKCMQIASSNPPASLLQTILESFNQLLSRHPTIFRSYLKQLHQLLAQILSVAPSNKISREEQHGQRLVVTSDVSQAALRLYVQLPCCAAKGAASGDWDKALRGVVSNAHRTADKVFRAVVEDWQSAEGVTPTVNGHALDDEVQDSEMDSMDLSPWSGIYAGGERLVTLLRLVKGYLSTPTPGSVIFPLGLVMDLATRMLSLTVPSSSSSSSARFNHQISKNERENLWNLLPQVHIATIEILVALMYRSEGGSAVLDAVILEQLGWVFEAEQHDMHIRTACYLSVAQLLARSGAALPKSSIDSLATLIRACCNDLLQLDSMTNKAPTQDKANGTNQHQASTNADTYLKSSSSWVDPLANYGGLRQAAFDLLPIQLSNIQPQLVSDKLITTMHRTAILTQHKDALIASVLNPPQKKKSGKPAASLLPLLLRSFGDDKEVESFVRPRMPVMRIRGRQDDAEDEAEDDISDAMEEEDDHFVGEELDTLLESASHANNRGGDDASTEAETRNVLDQTSLSPATLPAAPAAEPSNASVDDFELQKSFSKNKRLQEEGPPPAPMKRVKFDTADQEQPITTTSIPTTVMIPSSDKPDTPTIVSAEPEIVSQSIAPAPAAATLPTAPTQDNSDDNDDFGELVLGQDTDEESDS